MVLDYVTIGISLAIFIVYVIIVFLSFDIRKRLDPEAGRSSICFIIAVLFLIIRRLQQIFVKSIILHPVQYSAEIVTAIFSIFLLLAVLNFHKALRKAEERNKLLFPQTGNY